MICNVYFTFKGNNQMKALTNLNETLKVYNKVLHRFHEELMKVNIPYIYLFSQNSAYLWLKTHLRSRLLCSYLCINLISYYH